MQTFVPDTNIERGFQLLDRQRLGKQRIECKQIINALTIPGYGWANHPAVKMWAGFEGGLLAYSILCCHEWRSRGYKDQQLEWFEERLTADSAINLPDWWGDDRVHSSHRANLIRKDPEHYGFDNTGWSEEPQEGYFWPTHEEKEGT